MTEEQYPVLGLPPLTAQKVQQLQQQTGQFLPPGLAPSRLNTPIVTQVNLVENEDQIPDMDKFGLKGLLSTIRMENIEQSKFTIGTDLNMLGLDLLEKDKLSKKFETPWPEIIRTEVEPSFKFEQKFHTFDRTKISDEKFNSFTDETLFFIFYTKPNNYLQELASKQLNSRNWRFHKDLQLWLTKDSNVEPIPQGNQSERGIYIFFDPSSWEKVKKEFVLQYLSLHQAI